MDDITDVKEEWEHLNFWRSETTADDDLCDVSATKAPTEVGVVQDSQELHHILGRSPPSSSS